MVSNKIKRTGIMLKLIMLFCNNNRSNSDDSR